jgi:cytoskeleton protein RodZ
MTAESSTPEVDDPYLSPGTILRQAREEAGLAMEDVVAETRMTLHNVRALENDDFARLQSDTFTRGYLRMYAKLLKVDVEALLAAYGRARRDAGLDQEDPDTPLQNTVPAPSRPLWHFAVWILGLLAGLWILSVWFLGNESDGEGLSGDRVMEAELVASSGADPVSPSVGSVETPEAEAPISDDEYSSLIEPASATTYLAESEVLESEPLDQLHLTFIDECWLVVTDARGDVLVTDLVQPGRELNLQGQAPFEVKMGNAPAVQLSLNGEAFDLDVPAGARLMTVSVGQ